LAEAMVALIDDPHRFKRARDVGLIWDWYRANTNRER